MHNKPRLMWPHHAKNANYITQLFSWLVAPAHVIPISIGNTACWHSPIGCSRKIPLMHSKGTPALGKHLSSGKPFGAPIQPRTWKDGYAVRFNSSPNVDTSPSSMYNAAESQRLNNFARILKSANPFCFDSSTTTNTLILLSFSLGLLNSVWIVNINI